MELVFLILIMFLAGIFAGLLAGLFGIGGGLVVVPTLLYVFHVLGIGPDNAIHLAIGTSLSTVIVTSFMATKAHAKKDSVDFELVKSYTLPTIFGSILGVVCGVNLGARTLILMLAVFLFLLSFKFIFPKMLKEVSLGDDLPQGLMKYIYGLLLGGCSVLFGIGGGSLVVTVMTLYKRPIHQAIGTASAFGVVISIVGCLTSIFVGLSVDGLPFGSFGYVNLIGFLGIVTSSSFAAPFGVKLAHKLDQVLLKRVFGLYLIFTAIKLGLGVF
jgi:uncharacterized protein